MGVRIFAGILSSGNNAAVRSAIRATWGGDARLRRVMFFVARPKAEALFDIIRNEAAAFADIVVVPDVLEHYYNITYQTLEIFRIAAVYEDVTNVFKTDDDSYVRIGRLLQVVKQMPFDRAYLGRGFPLTPDSQPPRDSKHPFYVSVSEWPEDTGLPRYMWGLGYVLTMDLVREIAYGAAHKAMRSDRHLRIEDIAMSTWVDYISKERNWTINFIYNPNFAHGCHNTDVVSYGIKSSDTLCCMYAKHGECC
eukprot:jgi/Chrzof1/9313/UNPLg00282.t1